MKHMKSLALLLLFISVLIFTGCSSSNSSSNTSPSTPEPSTQDNTTKEEPAKEENRTLTIALGTDMVSFDIHDHNNTSTEAIHINMFNYLFKNDRNQVLQPELAESYEIVDETTWHIQLKEGITFHNGDPFTAEDVKFSLERVAQDSALREHPNYRQIVAVNILDPYKVEIITDGPQPALLNRLSRLGSGMLPKNYIETNGWDTFLKEPVGTGPFQFVEWLRDDRIVFEPYPNYWEGAVEEWDKLVFRVIPESSTRVGELLTGGVDIAVNTPPNEWDRINNHAGTSVVSQDTNRVILLNVRHTEGTPTADPRVREAIDLAINNEALTQFVLGGSGTPTRTRVTPGNFGSNEALFNTFVYDVERAKQLLAEAGYPNGFDITFQSPHGRYLQDRDIAEMVVGMLSEVGINATLEFMEWSTFVEMRNSKTNKELYMIGYGNSLFDADLVVDLYRSGRAEGEVDYNNPEVDELIAAARINMNPEERAAQYKRIQEIVAEERPHIHLYLEKSNYGVSDRLDFTPRLDEMLYAPHITRK